MESDTDVLNFTNFIDCFNKELMESKTKYTCSIENCQLSYADKSGAIRHLLKAHKDLHERIKNNKSDKNERSGNNVAFNDIELRVKVNPNEIIEACVDLITIKSLPISIVDSECFKKLIKPYEIALKQKNIKLVINRSNILKHIQKKANRIKEAIIIEVQKKFVCLMIDIASKYNRSVLGINIAFMKNSKIRVRTIGMHPLKKAHTAENLCEIIKQHLLEYKISLNQIFSITSDNGSNMIKTIALLDATYQQQRASEPGFVEAERNIWGSILEENSFDSDDEVEDFIFDGTYYNDLLTGVRMHFSAIIYSDLIQGISCAAHCLHLVVIKSIDKAVEEKKLIEKCREVSKKLRRPTFRNLIKSKNLNLDLNQAKIDVETRWNSIYLMVRNLKLLYFYLFFFVFFMNFYLSGIFLCYLFIKDNCILKRFSFM